MFYNSRIILIKIATYYSQNYGGIAIKLRPSMYVCMYVIIMYVCMYVHSYVFLYTYVYIIHAYVRVRIHIQWRLILHTVSQ